VNYNIGIIGGGQLGMMMVEEAHKLGYTCAVLDPSKDCPCSKVCDYFIEGSFNKLADLDKLAKVSEVLSYEFENVDGKILSKLDDKYNIAQGIKPLLDSQDRLREKMNALKNGLKTCKFYDCSSILDLKKAISIIGFPCIYKTRRDGYDGHGQVILNCESDIEKVKPYLENNLGIIEEKIDFDFECSIIMIRSKDQIIHFPISRNIHKNGILDLSIVPAKIDKKLEEEMIKQSINFMINANYYGILTIEYFVKGDKFYFNEMAPRPHNSGHYTIEGCQTNQFKELIKFLKEEKLEIPKLKSETLMKNILGKDLINLDKLFEIPNGYIHMYHKKEKRINRKLGHITYRNMNEELFSSYKKKLKIEE